jgi:NodT family efflux transporter outer membrane factor (OMF) lipoprotein
MRRAACVLSILTASCAVGPDFHRPAAPATERYLPDPQPASSIGAEAAGDLQRFLADRALPADWWTAFGSRELDELVATAFRANPTVVGAQAALRQARENLAVQRAAWLPTVGANVAASRQRNAVDVLSPTLTSGAPVFNLYTATVNVTYGLDILGVNRRQVEALRAVTNQSRFQLEATYLTVAGNVVMAAIQSAGLRAEIAATARAIALQRESLAILERQLELGAVAGLDVAAQRAALAQSEASLPPLQRSLEQTRHLLAILTGNLPAEAPEPPFTLETLTLPADVPVGVPSQLVARRPDVRVAEEGLHAATAAVGVAIGNLLPQVTITADAGSAATAMADLFRTSTRFWSAGASLSQTLFDGGALLHRKRAADAALDAAGAQYRATVLTAFQNVADALRALEADAATLEAARRGAAAAEDSFRIVRRQLELGAVSYLALVSAEQSFQQASVALAQARSNRLADTAALFQSLAGDAGP